MITIYHNGKCSKSKGALEILMEQNIPHEIRYYLVEPLSKQELTGLLKKLSIKPSELVRKNEHVYIDIYGKEEHTEDQWLNILVENPVLIERPIVVNGSKAIIARPPERVMTIL